ncbi:MAG: hypothetical protein ACT4PU_09325 [Planctomycetota bacterium]
MKDDGEATEHPEVNDGFDHGWEGHARRQALLGLSVSPAERLRLMEELVTTMRRWVGRAKGLPPAGPDSESH